MSNNNQCPTFLLSDDPAESDDLGGAHSRLAKAISDLIKREIGGKTIRLEGPWGSGKSTVINLLEQELVPENNNVYSTFYFDAWAHEGDPLRRTFLERLIDHLQILEGDWIEREMAR